MKIISIYILILFWTTSCGKDDDLKNYVAGTPSAVQLIFPENFTECITGKIKSETQSEVVFRWEASDSADIYELHITNLFLSITSTYSTEKTELPITIERGTPYSWYVSSRNIVNTTNSEIWSFYNSGSKTEYFIPFPAQIINPENRSILTSNQNSIVLEWEGSDLDSDILNYDVYFDKINPPAVYEQNITQNKIAIMNLSSGTKYYWKIKTRDVLGNESNSNIFTFEIE